MDNSFAGIRIFSEVVLTGSFSKAAEALLISPSAVSKSISQLEKRLGVTLFHRTTRQLKLTEAGQVYNDSCRKVLEELARTEQELSLRTQSLKGQVRIDLPVLYGKQFVLPLVLNLQKKHPEIEFIVTFNNTSADLIEDDIDLVVRIGDLDPNIKLKARYLGIQQTVLCASKEYLKKYPEPKVIEDLKRHQCLMSPGSTSWLFTSSEGKNFSVAVQGKLKLQGADAILQAALAGMGIAQLPLWLADEALQKGSLKQILGNQSAALPVHALWLSSSKNNAKIRVVIDELLRGFEKVERLS